jgi:hypothetical protein
LTKSFVAKDETRAVELVMRMNQIDSRPLVFE